MDSQVLAGTDNVTIGLFVIGVATTAFFSMISPRPLLRKTLAVFSFIGIIIGVLILLGYLPSLAGKLSDVAGSAWAWFAVVTLAPVINLVWSIWQGRGEKVRLPVPALPKDAALLEQASSLPQRELLDIAFIVTQAWLDPYGKKYPLRLHFTWFNQSGDIHVGKPQWEANKVQAYLHEEQLPLIYQFLYRHEGETERKEYKEVDVEAGRSCELWITLDSTVPWNEVKELEKKRRLGTVVLPIAIGARTKDVKLRF